MLGNMNNTLLNSDSANTLPVIHMTDKTVDHSVGKRVTVQFSHSHPKISIQLLKN
jgi:hypothetical protein